MDMDFYSVEFADSAVWGWKEERKEGGVFRQQRAVCGWEVLATEAVPHPFNSGQPLPALDNERGEGALWKFLLNLQA